MACAPVFSSMSQLRVTSPALSTNTAASSLTNSTRTASDSTVTPTGVNYAELFEEIDWNEVNLIKLESDWRAELEQIERDNVQALMDSTSKAQVVLPAVFKVIEEISKLSNIYEDYADDLRVTGVEIQQIESLNRGLETQTLNQQRLLDELQKIIDVVALPDGVLDVLQKLPLDAPNSISKVERAARELYNLLTVKFEGGIQDIKAVSDRLRYYNEQHDQFAKRLVQFISNKLVEITSKSSQIAQSPRTSQGVILNRHDEIVSFLSAYRPLVLLCKSQSPREHYDICSAFQNSFGSLITRDLSKFFESLRASHLLKRPATEPSSSTIDENKAAATFTSLANVGRTFTASTKNFTEMQLLKPEDLPFLGENEFIYADQAMEFIVLTVAMNIELNRRMVAQMIFGCESFETGTIDLKVNRKIQAIIAGVYASLGEKLPAFISQCIKLDESCAIDMLAVLDVRLPQIPDELAIFGKILEAVQQNLTSYVEFFLESQIEAIRETKYSAKRRSGVFSYVETFPRFIARIEGILATCGVTSKTASSRSLVNRYFEKIGQCIFDSFDALNAEVDETDEKGHINASVMTIENSHYLYKELTDLKMPLLDPIVRSAQSFYDRSLVNYASLSIYRVLGRYAEYFEGLSNLLKTTAPQEVAFSSTYSKASVKKMLNSVTLKDMKKAIDLLHQRVLKHFADQPKMIQIVWKAVQQDLLTRQTDIVEGISKVFPGATDISLPFSLSSLNDYFSELSRHQ